MSTPGVNDEPTTLTVRGTPPGGRKRHLDPGSFEAVVHRDPETGRVTNSGWKVPWMLNEERRLSRRLKGYLFTVGGVLMMSVMSLLIVIIVITPLLSAEAGWGSYMFALVGAGVALVISLFLLLFGLSILSDSKLIPLEPVQMPERIELVQDEIWRQPTSFRYLETLKEVISSNEQRANELFDTAIKAYERLSFRFEGYWEFKDVMKRIGEYEQFKNEYLQQAALLKVRASRVSAGDVDSEVLELEAKIKALKRERQELEATLAERLSEVINNQDPQRIKKLEKRKKEIQGAIRDLDLTLIQLEAHVRELQDKRLSTEPSEEETRRKAASERIKQTITFDVGVRLGKNLTTLDKIQRFYKERSQAIKDDNSLSYDEKSEQLAQLQTDCEQYKRELKVDMNIYEDE